MMMDPILQKKLRRFRRNRRAHFSFWIISVLFVLSLGSEWICNNTPFALRFQGRLYFPMFHFYPASLFGDLTSTIPNYKKLNVDPTFRQDGNWMIFPPIPFGPNESVENLPVPPPSPPSAENWLGTDDRGRDLLTRLVYGFRNSMVFRSRLVDFHCLHRLPLRCITRLSSRPGRLLRTTTDRSLDRAARALCHYFPFEYFSIKLGLLAIVWVAFSWIGLSTYVRAEVLRARKQDFVTAARALGASTPRLLFRHILPNSLTPILTFSPFIISASIGALAALDYLGLGLPPPTASWGELLRQGKENLSSWWLALFPFFSLFGTLLLLNFIGEGVRSAFDARETN